MRLQKRMSQHGGKRWNSRIRKLESVRDAWRQLKSEEFRREEIRGRVVKINFTLVEDLITVLTIFKLATDAHQAGKTPTYDSARHQVSLQAGEDLHTR